MRSYLAVPIIIAIFVLAFLIVCIGYGKDSGEFIRYKELFPMFGVLIAIIAIVMSLFAGLGYFLLDRVLEERVTKFVEEKSVEWSNQAYIKSLITTGYVYYNLSELNPNLLNLAITETNEAFKFKPSEHLECWAKNNLAFYCALRNQEGDVDGAREYSEFIFDKSPKYYILYPVDAIEWRMTRAYVIAKHPVDSEQKEAAKKIYESLLKMEGITLDQANKIQGHIKNFWP